ncbi:hypothetical protein Anapl_14280 [Anas platyrhynchos]|uniref:Uncharacterized protein n=1 Tax=Anas platyrhynchos TaxID=8839 RepID=R0KC53_ANAPL|nr:hypothetical protein Anapl_14280 [Anas platyrhynchos]
MPLMPTAREDDIKPITARVCPSRAYKNKFQEPGTWSWSSFMLSGGNGSSSTSCIAVLQRDVFKQPVEKKLDSRDSFTDIWTEISWVIFIVGLDPWVALLAYSSIVQYELAVSLFKMYSSTAQYNCLAGQSLII